METVGSSLSCGLHRHWQLPKSHFGCQAVKQGRLGGVDIRETGEKYLSW